MPRGTMRSSLERLNGQGIYANPCISTNRLRANGCPADSVDEARARLAHRANEVRVARNQETDR
ncbi:MAG: hypothetical protein R3313_01595 [Candidatus Saccharimonadales bacterium]|nr:hypothetical protein [Candidatus Saccharimonadales bacterium]